jgi:hypothetical protein
LAEVIAKALFKKGTGGCKEKLTTAPGGVDAGFQIRCNVRDLAVNHFCLKRFVFFFRLNLPLHHRLRHPYHSIRHPVSLLLIHIPGLPNPQLRLNPCDHPLHISVAMCLLKCQQHICTLGYMHAAQVCCYAINCWHAAVTCYITYHTPQRAKLPLRLMMNAMNGFIDAIGQ